MMYYEPSELMREATVHFNILGIDAALRFAAESRIRRTDLSFGRIQQSSSSGLSLYRRHKSRPHTSKIE